MKHRGRPTRGAIAGFFFGLFLSLDLLIFGVVATDAAVLALLPLLGVAAGIALGLTAPMKRRSSALSDAPVPAEAQVTELQPADRPPAMATPEPDRSSI